MKYKHTVTVKYSDDEVAQGQSAIRKLIKCEDISFAIYDLDNWLRSEIKYRDAFHLQPVRDKLWEIIKYRELEDIIE